MTFDPTENLELNLRIVCRNPDHRDSVRDVMARLGRQLEQYPDFICAVIPCDSPQQVRALTAALNDRGENWTRRVVEELLMPGADESMRMLALGSALEFLEALARGEKNNVLPLPLTVVLHRARRAMQVGGGEALVQLVGAVGALMTASNPEDQAPALEQMVLAMRAINGQLPKLQEETMAQDDTVQPVLEEQDAQAVAKAIKAPRPGPEDTKGGTVEQALAEDDHDL